MPKPPNRRGGRMQAPIRPAATPPLIVLTTDFGLADGYVGIMRGVILAIARGATVVDLSHEVPPHDIDTASFLIECSWRYFPPDAVHVVVVDPGVGGDRAILAVGSPSGIFLAPDNGVLSSVIRCQSGALPISGGRVSTSELGNDLTIRQVANTRYWRPSVSDTFHGRDIFAPVAAHIALGTDIDDLGPVAESVLLLPCSVPLLRADGTLQGRVVYVDRFGNLITNIGANIAQTSDRTLHLSIKGHSIHGLHRSYASGPALLAIIGSSGRVEISRRNGSAAAALSAGVGDIVEVQLVAEGEQE